VIQRGFGVIGRAGTVEIRTRASGASPSARPAETEHAVAGVEQHDPTGEFGTGGGMCAVQRLTPPPRYAAARPLGRPFDAEPARDERLDRESEYHIASAGNAPNTSTTGMETANTIGAVAAR
jgi:hypothetical protein